MAEEIKEQMRSTLRLKERRDLAVWGIGAAALAVLIFLFISYQLVFIIYALLSIFIFSSYIMLWNENDREIEIENPKEWPSLSVIIPSFNSRKTIFECIKACRRMKYPKEFEIVVIDDCSTDGSYEMLKKIDGIKLFRKERNAGKASALNFGLSKARGEIVVCVDSDTYPECNTLTEAVKHFFEDGRVASVVVFVCVNKPKNLLERIQEIEYWISFGFFFRTIARINSLYVTPGPTAFYKRKILQKIGGFDEQNLSEDLEIALRLQKLGYRIAATHKALVKTDVPQTLGQLYRQRLRWYRGGVANIIKYIELFFNPKYGQFGLFVLPTMLGSGFFAALFMTWTLLFWGRSLLSWIAPFFYDFSAGLTLAGAGIGKGIFILNSAWILWLFSLVLWAYFLAKSFELAKTQMEGRHIVPLICMISLYPLFIGFSFLVSYIYELFGVKYSW